VGEESYGVRIMLLEGGKEFTSTFVVMYVYVSSGGIFKIVTAEVQELI